MPDALGLMWDFCCWHMYTMQPLSLLTSKWLKNWCPHEKWTHQVTLLRDTNQPSMSPITVNSEVSKCFRITLRWNVDKANRALQKHKLKMIMVAVILWWRIMDCIVYGFLLISNRLTFLSSPSVHCRKELCASTKRRILPWSCLLLHWL